MYLTIMTMLARRACTRGRDVENRKPLHQVSSRFPPEMAETDSRICDGDSPWLLLGLGCRNMEGSKVRSTYMHLPRQRTRVKVHPRPPAGSKLPSRKAQLERVCLLVSPPRRSACETGSIGGSRCIMFMDWRLLDKSRTRYLRIVHISVRTYNLNCAPAVGGGERKTNCKPRNASFLLLVAANQPGT